MIQRSQIAADDEGAFINSEDFLLDSQKQTAVHAQVQVRTQPMISFKQDLSFVEKVHIPEEQIVRLCNRIVPNSWLQSILCCVDRDVVGGCLKIQTLQVQNRSHVLENPIHNLLAACRSYERARYKSCSERGSNYFPLICILSTPVLHLHFRSSIAEYRSILCHCCLSVCTSVYIFVACASLRVEHGF